MSERFELRVPDGWLARLDEGRGRESRAVFVRRVVEAELRRLAPVDPATRAVLRAALGSQSSEAEGPGSTEQAGPGSRSPRGGGVRPAAASRASGGIDSGLAAWRVEAFRGRRS